MARAETIETVGEHEVVGNGPVPCHNTCRMEVPRPLHDWPGALITTPRSTRSGSAIVRHRYHHLEPFQVLNLSYPPAFPGLEGREQLRRASTRVTPPPSPGSEQRNRGTDAQRDSSGEPSVFISDRVSVTSPVSQNSPQAPPPLPTHPISCQPLPFVSSNHPRVRVTLATGQGFPVLFGFFLSLRLSFFFF
ncbi:bcl-2-binding component 3 isoform X2 [Austrofundulus limnaeus]|uniref:Bcl-2-binding component 3 isoform X2 n=1 Tax=Austrofundulus limnaeus TaxID=52670 RepID=A0A2I4D6E1_AUSLI|nr:PREDICTED: uncharacterized protein LOC106535360 isoform X2 [Austrofundulus limnaeus]